MNDMGTTKTFYDVVAGLSSVCNQRRVEMLGASLRQRISNDHLFLSVEGVLLI
jgi:hypothetical protein